MTLPPTPRPPHPYARRHLAAHAAAGGKLDDDVLNLETLPYLDEARLSTLLRLTEPAPLSRQWLLLSAWRSIRHRWSWDDPDANAAALDVAQLAVDPMAPLPDRWTASGLGWKPRLVEWQSGGTIVAGDERGGLRLIMGAVQGVPILLTGDPWWVRLWDPATGQPIGEPLHAPHLILALAVAEGPGLVVAACEGGHVIAWDAMTHVPSATVEISEPIPAALAVGEIEDRWVVAAGGASGVVQVRWIDSGELIHEFRDNKQVRAVALAKTRSGRLHLAIGYGDGEDGWIAVHDAASGEPRNPGIAVRGEVNDAALALVEGELVVAAGTTMGIAGVWNALSGAPASSPVSHDGEVSSVALATIGGSQLLATGSRDRTARLWYVPSGGSAGPPLPHPAPVESLAFGEVDGRTMLVTGCLDGNTRLWDPLRASAARVAVEGWFPSVAMDTDLVVAESDDGHVRLWNIASGNSYPPLPVEPGYEPSSEPVDLPSVKVRLGGIHPRILLAQYGGRVGIWDMSDSSEPAFRGQTEIGNMTDFDLHAGRGLPLLATLDDAGEVMVVDLPAGTRLFQIRIGGADSVTFIETPEHLLLGVGVRGQMHLLDVESGEQVCSPLPVSPPHKAAVGRLDGTDILAVVDADGLRLYDLRTGELTIPPVEMPSTANGIAWGRVGDRDVVVTEHSATVRVWNPRTGRKITELPFGTRIGAMSVQPTDGGQLLVAVSGPGLVLTDLRETSWPPEQQTTKAPTGLERGIPVRSVPKPVFTDAEAGAKTFPDSTKREFNYYTPQKRKQSRYEDVTVEVQPDPRHYLAQGWLYGFSDGRGGYPLDWTALKAWGSDRPEPERFPGSGGKGYDWPAHGWHLFRDPNEEWELSLYRYNSNVVRQLNQNIDVARQSKAFDLWNRNWVRFVESHVGAWMHVDHGLGLYLFANAQRRAPTNMHNNAISVNSMHRIRSAQDLALYNLALSEEIDGFDGAAHLAAWNSNPVWQGVREVAEQLTGIDDWCEAIFAANVIFEPLVGELFRSQLVMHAAPRNGNFVTPTVIGAEEYDFAERDLRYTTAMFHLLTNDREFADHNKELLGSWLSTWTARAIAASRTLQPLWSQPDNKPPRFEDGLDAAKSRFAAILTDLNLDAPKELAQ